MQDPTPVGALTHGPSLDGNDPLARHVSTIHYDRNGRPILVLRNNHPHIGGNDDMKPGVLIEEIVWIW